MMKKLFFASLCSICFCCCSQKKPGGEFRIDERFQIALFAAEPLLDGPVAMVFDERGRIFVQEAPHFPPLPSDRPRVIQLEDKDGDGRPDKASVVTEAIAFPPRNQASDPQGRRFSTSPDSHIQLEGRSISDHGERPLIFPVTEDPVYPVLTDADRTTSSCGLVFYANRSIPGFERALFVTEPAHNLIHCDLPSQSGPAFIARRSSDQAEFLASTDPLFRPVSFTLGPDGAIYVVDYYAPLAGPTEILEVGTKPLDRLFEAVGKGRIYRITPSGKTSDFKSRTSSPPADPSPQPDTTKPEIPELPADRAGLEKVVADPTRTDSIHASAVRALGDMPGVETAVFLLAKWRNMTTAPRMEALEALFKEPSRLNLLLDALEKEQIPLWCLDDEHRVRILTADDRAQAERARKMLAAREPSREPVIRNYEAALDKKGDRAAGETVYRRLCGRCHTFRGGSNYGPDLWTVSSRPRRRILTDILLPSNAMARGREMYMIDLKGGGSVDGVIGSQNETSLFVLHDESRQETVLRQDIRRILLSDTSAMPVDLASQLSVQDLADLLRFLTSR